MTDPVAAMLAADRASRDLGIEVVDAGPGRAKARMAVTDNDLEALGRERAQAVQAALIEKGRVDASRVFITAPQAKDEKALKAKTGQPTGTLKTDLNPSAGAGMPKGGPERGVVRMELALS